MRRTGIVRKSNACDMGGETRKYRTKWRNVVLPGRVIIFHVALLLIGNRSFAVSDNIFDKADVVRRVLTPTPAPTKGCQPWCANNANPWVDPDPDVEQKCNFPITCGGCPQCAAVKDPTPSPTSQYPCLTWCAGHEKPWYDSDSTDGRESKCKWKEKCAGCPQCFQDETTSPTRSPSEKPSSHPSTLSSSMPSDKLSSVPTAPPTNKPTVKLTSSPTAKLTPKPTAKRTSTPTAKPTATPTANITRSPSKNPTRRPTKSSTSSPTSVPTKKTSSPTIETERKEASFSVRLRVGDRMGEEEEETFRAITENFFNDNIEEANVEINAVKVEDQRLEYISPVSERGIKIVEEDGRRYLSSQDMIKFLFVDVLVEGKAPVSFDDFEGTIKEIIEDKLGNYAEALVKGSQGSNFFRKVTLDFVKYDAGSDGGGNNTLSDPLSVTAVVVGGLTGSLVMLVAGVMLIRRQSGRSDDWRKSKMGGFQRFSSRKDPANNDEKVVKNEPDVTNLEATKEENHYPQSINFSSQDSFSTITFSEMMSRKNQDGEEPWENPLKKISEHDSNDDNTPPDKPKSVNSEGRSNSLTGSVKSISEYLAAGKQLVEISASPGPLGLVVKSSEDGPVVCEINEDSPLIDKLHLGDIVVSVNNIDVRHMSAISFAKYIVSKEQEPERLIAVLRTMKMFAMSV